MKLREKVTLLTTTIAVSIVFLTLLPVRNVVINAFRGELEKKSISIAGNLSDRIANYIILKDYFQTSRAITDVLHKEEDVEYIFVTDEEGMLFTHTFENGHPANLLSWNPLNNEAVHVQLLDTEKGYIRDAGVRVISGTKAELHIGIREDELNKTLTQMRYITIPIILGVVILGGIASLIFSRLITDPLNKFVEFTKVLGRGEYGKRVDVKYGDEIGYLARNFNRLSEQLKSAREKMEEAYTYTHLLQTEKLSAVGQISAGLAHELKNPLTSLKMLFQDFEEQPHMTKEDAKVITTEIEKMDTVLSNFMGFVKQKGLRFTETDLHGVIDRVLSLARYDLEKAQVSVRKDMLENLPRIRADRGLLEQVFLNLIINAIDAMHHGGEIRISGKSDHRFAEVMIWDEGEGISADFKDKIFNPFFTTKQDGTGLGLAIAYNIVKSHGGKLSFNSAKGKGTVFTVKLPIGDTGE